MSYRLIKQWEKNPSAAARESCFHMLMLALIVLFILSDRFSHFPPAWQIIIFVIVVGFLIWGIFYHAKTLENAKFKDDARYYINILQNLKIDNWADIVEWKLEDNCGSWRIQSVDEIVETIRSVMNKKREYMILSPAEPVNACVFMQAICISDDYMKIEISLCCEGNKTHIYSTELSVDETTNILVSFYTKGIVPSDITEWFFEMEAKR